MGYSLDEGLKFFFCFSAEAFRFCSKFDWYSEWFFIPSTLIKAPLPAEEKCDAAASMLQCGDRVLLPMKMDFSLSANPLGLYIAIFFFSPDQRAKAVLLKIRTVGKKMTVCTAKKFHTLFCYDSFYYKLLCCGFPALLQSHHSASFQPESLNFSHLQISLAKKS